MKKLYFVRHGLSELNVQSLYAGITDTPLTDEGRRQAKLAGQHAKQLDIDYIISSPLSRALETAQIIAKEIGYPLDNIEVNSLFIERDFGALEAQPWKPDLDLDGVADIEKPETLVERARLAIEHIKTLDADHILIVSHGSFGRAIRHHFDPDKPYQNKTSSGELKIPNAEIIQWF